MPVRKVVWIAIGSLVIVTMVTIGFSWLWERLLPLVAMQAIA